MKRLAFHPEAEVEFARASEFYDAERAGLGAEFVNAVDQATAFVLAHPDAGTPVRAGLRRWLVRRFPYSIIYREEPERVYVLAVAHQRRQPGYWRERV